MPDRETTGQIIDDVLRFAATSAVLATGMLIPNALIALEKPLNRYLKNLDQYAREREARRVISYMKSQGLLAGEYEHGLKITKKGQKRLKELDFEMLRVPHMAAWDHKWRIVFYDIPEQHKYGRDLLTAKLRELGFHQLQQSVWIHPLPSRPIIEKVTTNFGLEKYVSYIETSHIDNQLILIQRFKKTTTNHTFQINSAAAEFI